MSEYNNCIINEGIANDIELIVNPTGSDNIDWKKLSELFEQVLIESDKRSERELARNAKLFADEKSKGKLKELIKSNLSTFVSGTFANLAGGLLLDMIKGFM